MPANASDPLLAAWTKLGPVNSLAPPPGGTRGQFHDPSVFASVGALSPAASGLPPPRWRLLVGAQVDCRGAAALFTSPDFKNWTFASLLDAQGPGASLAERLGQRCDQYGDAAGGGALWETPAVFSVPPRAGGTSRNQSSSAVVFKYGLQIAHAPRFATDLFAVGDLEELPGAQPDPTRAALLWVLDPTIRSITRPGPKT